MDCRNIITLNTATWSLCVKNSVTKTGECAVAVWDMGGQDEEMSYLFSLCIASILTSGKKCKVW